MRVVKEIHCKTWEEFKNKSSNLSSNKDYVFRGQNDSNWPLETSLQRFFKRVGVTSFSLAGIDPVEEILEKYIPLINIIEKNHSYTERSDYWSVGQHYGLPTPYLDWTKTVYKAAFFAFSDEIMYNNTHNNIAIYGLKIRNIHELAGGNINMQNHLQNNGGIKTFEREGFSIVGHNTRVTNSRIESQDGIFTIVNGLNNMHYDLVEFFNEKIYDVYRLIKPIMVKFTIPRTEYKKALLDLHHTTQINFFKIYPDKEGCAKQVRFESILKF